MNPLLKSILVQATEGKSQNSGTDEPPMKATEATSVVRNDLVNKNTISHYISSAFKMAELKK